MEPKYVKELDDTIKLFFFLVVFSKGEIPSKPVIYNNSTTRVLVAREGQPVKLECLTGGFPAPIVSWTRDGIIYKYSTRIINSLKLQKVSHLIFKFCF